jgi:hypothetical protein
VKTKLLLALAILLLAAFLLGLQWSRLVMAALDPGVPFDSRSVMALGPQGPVEHPAREVARPVSDTRPTT